MRFIPVRRISALIAAVCATCAIPVQSQIPANEIVLEGIDLAGEIAFSWETPQGRFLLIRGPSTLTLEETRASARSMVVRINPRSRQRMSDITVVLVGEGRIERGDVVREGENLLLTATIRSNIAVDAKRLLARNMMNDPVYQAAAEFVADEQILPTGVDMSRGRLDVPLDPQVFEPPPLAPTEQIGGVAVTRARDERAVQGAVARARSPVSFRADRASMQNDVDGRVLIVLTGNVTVVQRRADGDLVEIRADNTVLFTTVTDMQALLEGGEIQGDRVEDQIAGAYAEGSVTVLYTPASPRRAEQRLRASRLFYDLQNDRAILSDALLATSDPTTRLPLTVRAETIRQVAQGQYEAERAQVSTSQFATPSFAVRANRVTVSQEDTGDDRFGTRTSFRSTNVTLNSFGVPFFWLPAAWGSVTERGSPLREILFSSRGGYGVGLETTWGLFESAGIAPPAGVDATVSADYFEERGPATGLDLDYRGLSLTPAERAVRSFSGEFTSYLVHDSGEDRPGAERPRVDRDDFFRGRAVWRHQHFLPDDWQVQVQAGYVSDAAFLQQWFRSEFRNNPPVEQSIYLKRTVDQESLSLLVVYDALGLVTSADQLQEFALVPVGSGSERRPYNIERLPELSYDRIGETLGSSLLTVHSNNTLSGLRYSVARGDLNRDYLFRDLRSTPTIDESFTGLPSTGFTGVNDGDYIARGDTRQEIALPIPMGEVKLVPFVVGRYTAYSDTPDGSSGDRLLGGAGLRLGTSFWKVYEGFQSRLFDIDRVRHVVEPEVHLFASAASTDRGELYIFDENVDGISDLQSATFLVRQGWQTKRGDDARKRTSEFFTLTTGISAYGNAPDEVESLTRVGPFNARSFRGVFLASEPEASIPRNTAFADSVWRITDTTALLGDVAWNYDEQTLATTAAGFAVTRDPRTQYFANIRYIGEVNSTIVGAAINYQLSAKYAVNIATSLSISDDQNRNTTLSVVRRFDQFLFIVGVYVDQLEDENGVTFSVVPLGLNAGMGTGDFRVGAR